MIVSVKASKCVTFAVFNTVVIVVCVRAIWMLAAWLADPSGSGLLPAIVLLGSIAVIIVVFVIPGVLAVRRLRRVKSRWPSGRVYQTTPHENFDVLIAAYAAENGVGPPPYRPWDVYLVMDDDLVTFLAGSSNQELVSLRRSHVKPTVTYLLDWITVIPVLRLSVRGLPDVSFASSVLITSGMLSRGRRFLGRIAKQISADD
ncbi:hypothetical protein [Herbiconiux ginsengi]|uniref:Uncharacterized protein n=1 Tax=Herbiconiux ginsengi TaxID=381665 RepID=A0A1H3QFW4_9MICO|nr:hypothetical protein [Herbiconiux ginsengi]SDZ12153.1 hypothetical protein SAMN05216554_2497 [Herbiconiux ginsengi]